MFCTKCGKEVKENAKFCVHCGTPVTGIPGNTVSRVQSVQNHPEEKKKPKNKNSKKKNKIPVLVGLFTIIAVIAGFFVGGSLICNNRERVLAKSVEDYNISDFSGQNESLQSDYEEINFFDIFGKIKVVSELSDLQKQSKKADAELKDVKKSIEEMEAKKDIYDLAESYRDYEDALNNCKKALEQREYENTVNAFSDSRDTFEQLVKDNKAYVKDKLDTYETADWSNADQSDKARYDTDVQKINTLLADEKYGDMKSVFEEMDDIAFMYIEPENPLNVKVQQVDASGYPMVKLYVQLQDSAGDVPEKLDSNFFYVRKEDAKASYVRQKVAQVTQLNELEALNIDMVADVSGSMDGYPLDEAKSLMGEFISTVQFDAGDRVELTSFSTGVYLQQEFTDDASRLYDCIDGLYTDDMTSLYDALYTAVTRTAAQNGAKCVIAFTDGEDNYSNCTAQDVINTAQRYSVPIFIVGVGEVNSYEISGIAEATGGEYYSIGDIGSIMEIYDQIYKQEKELYMIEYRDETGAGISDVANIKVGYHSREYGGEEDYSYTPKILMSVDGSTVYDDGPEAVVEGYMRSFDDAMTESDFSYIADYLKKDSNIYKTQKKYVKKDFTEQLESYEISDIKYKDSNHCVITTRETYYVQKEGEALNLLTQQCKYKLTCVNGEWKMTDFAGNVKVLSKIKR